jgi:PKD repeat protein
MYRTLLTARPSATGARLLTASLLCVLGIVTACTDSVLRPPAPVTLDAARSHADSDGAGYFRARAASRALTPDAAKRTLSSASATVVSVTPGWVQGNLQRQPIVATLSGNVNSVKVQSGQSPGDAILCSGSYGTLIAYDANGAVLGSTPLSLIDPADCGSDNVTFGAEGTVVVTQGVIASFKILPMSPFEFTVNGVKGGHATATFTATLGEYGAVDNPPKASFSAGCDYNTLTCVFDASGSTDDVGIVSYAWDLNTSPGGSASGKVVQMTYPTAGPRTITLTVTDTKGQTNSSTMVVSVGIPAGKPPFSAVSAINCSTALTCTFDSSPSAGSSAITRSWKWGDGTTTGDVVVATHTFPAPAVYGVLLTITDAYGLSSSSAYALSLSWTPPAATNMSLGITSCAGLTCTFNASAAGSSTPLTFAWDFGDGTSAGNVTAPTHTFPASGAYAVVVSVTDAVGNVSAAAIAAKVSAPSPSDAPPVAAFTWTCVGLNPRQCAVDASTSTDDKGIVSYKWDWGNGRSETKSTSAPVRNTWAASGTYQVTLTVTDTKGQTNAVTKAVVVP